MLSGRNHPCFESASKEKPIRAGATGAWLIIHHTPYPSGFQVGGPKTRALTVTEFLPRSYCFRVGARSYRFVQKPPRGPVAKRSLISSLASPRAGGAVVGWIHETGRLLFDLLVSDRAQRVVRKNATYCV